MSEKTSERTAPNLPDQALAIAHQIFEGDAAPGDDAVPLPHLEDLTLGIPEMLHVGASLLEEN